MTSVAVLVVAFVALAVVAGVMVGGRNRRRNRPRWDELPVWPGGPVTEARVALLDGPSDQLLAELLEIGQNRGFLAGGRDDSRTREIGAELDQMDGMQKMLQVHAAVKAQLGQGHARDLERAWDGIGSWMG